MRQEEQQLEQQQNKSRDQLNELTKNLQDTQLQICQAKAKITHLQEQQRQMSDAIALYDSALAAGDATLVPDTSLQFNPEIEDLEYVSDIQIVSLMKLVTKSLFLLYNHIIDTKQQTMTKLKNRNQMHYPTQMDLNKIPLHQVKHKKHLVRQLLIHLAVHFHRKLIL